MKFDFSDSTLKDLISGRPLVEQVERTLAAPDGTPQIVMETVPITVLAIATVCMLRPTPEDGKLSFNEKIRRYKLGQKLVACSSSQDRVLELDSDEVSMIKTITGTLFGAMVVGQVVDFFEAAHNKQKQPTA